MRPYFQNALFILDGDSKPVPADTRYVYNQGGTTHFLRDPKGTPIPVTPENPSLARGRCYRNISWKEKEINPGTSGAYWIIEFDFRTNGEPVIYDPLWADYENCQAFGITLLRDGECLPFAYLPGQMVSADYTYGVFAGYESPYIGSEHDRDLLSVNATDLEYHAFPHLFCSRDKVHLVTSVARWRPEAAEIWLADLWVKPGDCLCLPPKTYNKAYTDMHGNRNSATACLGVPNKPGLPTNTTLGNSQVFSAPDTKPHYHEEKTHTVHSKPK